MDGEPMIGEVGTPRDELRGLVEQLPDEQVPVVVSQLRARLDAVSASGSWPPS
jgi:hypothetical protein